MGLFITVFWISFLVLALAYLYYFHKYKHNQNKMDMINDKLFLGFILASSFLIVAIIIASIFVAYIILAVHENLRKRLGKTRTEAMPEESHGSQGSPNSEEIQRSFPDITLTGISGPVRQRFRASLRTATDGGMIFDNAFALAMRDTSDALRIGDALQEAAQMRYPAETVASFMATKKFRLGEIASLIDDNYGSDFYSLVSVLAPLAPGETPEMRARELFICLGELYDIDDELPDLVARFEAMGCSKQSAVKVIYENSEYTLGKIIADLKLYEDPQVAAAMARDIDPDCDLCDEDEYSQMRSEGASLAQVAAILKNRDVGPSSIIEAEVQYEDISIEDVGSLVSALVSAGFSEYDVIDCLLDSTDALSESSGAILVAAFAAEVPADVLGRVAQERGLDADELDEEMRDAESDLETRFRIFQGYFGSSGQDNAGPGTSSTTSDTQLA